MSTTLSGLSPVFVSIKSSSPTITLYANLANNLWLLNILNCIFMLNILFQYMARNVLVLFLQHLKLGIVAFLHIDQMVSRDGDSFIQSCCYGLVLSISKRPLFQERCNFTVDQPPV